MDAGAAVAQDQRKRIPSRQRVADRLGKIAPPGDARSGRLKLIVELDHQRRCMRGSNRQALIGWSSANGVSHANAAPADSFLFS